MTSKTVIAVGLFAVALAGCGSAEVQVEGPGDVGSSPAEAPVFVDSGRSLGAIEFVPEKPEGGSLGNDSSPRSVEELVDRLYGGVVAIVANQEPRYFTAPDGKLGIWSLRARL